MIRQVVKVLLVVPAVVLLFSASASAQSIRLTAALSGANETPAAINTGAYGSAQVAVDVTNQELTVNVQVFNLQTGTTGGHIHAGGRGNRWPGDLRFHGAERADG